jgi:N-acylethanolamine-hydrolysing acid amidase
MMEAHLHEKVPKYTIDLDQPAATRWREVAHDFAAYTPFLHKLILQKVPPAVLPLAERVALYLDSLFDEPYPGEMKGIAEALNISLPEVILANIYYDITAYCTSIVAEDEKGNIFHARNLDYDNAAVFRNMSVHVDFLRNGEREGREGLGGGGGGGVGGGGDSDLYTGETECDLV